MNTGAENSFTSKRLVQSLYIHDKIPLLYVSNPKVACSTIKKSIWISSNKDSFLESSNPHDRYAGPFLPNLNSIFRNLDRLDGASIFSVVRNPYSRFVSAYEDKINRENRDKSVWTPIRLRYGFSADERPSMQTLLECLKADDPLVVDQHFARQSFNLLPDYIDYDFIGHLEEIDVIQGFLKKFDIQIISHTPHATGASAAGRYELSGLEVKLIQEIFEQDFAKFNYDLDPSNRNPLNPIEEKSVDRKVLSLIVKVSVERDPKSSAKIYHELQSYFPSHEFVHPRLEVGSISTVDVYKYSSRALMGEFFSWSIPAMLANKLIGLGDLAYAGQVLNVAISLYPNQAKKYLKNMPCKNSEPSSVIVSTGLEKPVPGRVLKSNSIKELLFQKALLDARIAALEVSKTVTNMQVSESPEIKLTLNNLAVMISSQISRLEGLELNRNSELIVLNRELKNIKLDEGEKKRLLEAALVEKGELQVKLKRARRKISEIESRQEAIYSSRSWRVAKSLSNFSHLFKRNN